MLGTPSAPLLLALGLLASSTVLGDSPLASKPNAKRPNILWITCEDISAHLGCYGCEDAITPTLDKLARQGVRYERAFAPIGVCAPARSCLITGMYPNSIGSQHMRCRGTWPQGVRAFPAWLRDAGYFTSNRSKTDYNLEVPRDAWDRNGRKAHWRQRKDGQPFFSVINFTTTHESQIRLPAKRFAQRTKALSDAERRDPESIAIPPYHPDLPEVRRDWANYHELITALDKQVANVLRQLEEDGLADDTIVFFYSDHGAGMPRSKRWLFDSGMHVPLIIRFGKNWKQLAPSAPGSVSERLVSFVDFGPTALRLAGVEVPKYMQGRAFLGKATARRQRGKQEERRGSSSIDKGHAASTRMVGDEARRYVYGFRGRMDERFDMQRAVRDARFKYIRNFRPHRIWGQYLDYMFQMPTTRAWHAFAKAKKGSPEQRRFWGPKPFEELYDTTNDPHEMHNLAGRPEHAATLTRMRKELARWMREIVDLGLLPEAELRRRWAGRSEYDAVRAELASYPLDALLAASRLCDSRLAHDNYLVAKLDRLVAHDDAALRWWGWTAISAHAEAAVRKGASFRPRQGKRGVPIGNGIEVVYPIALLERWIAPGLKALEDRSPTVRVAAAEALCHLGQSFSTLKTLDAVIRGKSEWDALRALTLVDRLDGAAKPLQGLLEETAKSKPKNKYLMRVAEKALADLNARSKK